MRLHILGICGTFMAGIATLAKQAGHEVSGSDQNVYPPMSTQLELNGIKLIEGYEAKTIDPTVDVVIVGNVIKRGNPAMEYILANNIPYISGPQWLAENILKNRWVLAVAGTHGKTTTTSLLTWILEHAGLNPGFLIGGVPENFRVSSRIGEGPFVIEADEYDSAFFDKRSKFIHYHPKTLILNNLEFDHADIFPNLEAITQQFHFLIRTVPNNGLIIRHATDKNLEVVLEKGCWSPVTTFSAGQGEWQAKPNHKDGSQFSISREGKLLGDVSWELLGNHNVENALAACAAASHVGVADEKIIEALPLFKNVKRRLEVKGKVNGIVVYDDFAHHPTAIATTLAGLRAKVGKERIVVVLEFGSYTMRTGVHKDMIKHSLRDADVVVCKQPESSWDIKDIFTQQNKTTLVCEKVESIIEELIPQLKQGDHVVVMSNSGFGGIHQKLMTAIEQMR